MTHVEVHRRTRAVRRTDRAANPVAVAGRRTARCIGLGVDSTSPASRLHMSRGATYRWLVRNAGRFGFVPYAFEPWHWEWVSPTGGYTGPPPPT